MASLPVRCALTGPGRDHGLRARGGSARRARGSQTTGSMVTASATRPPALRDGHRRALPASSSRSGSTCRCRPGPPNWHLRPTALFWQHGSCTGACCAIRARHSRSLWMRAMVSEQVGREALRLAACWCCGKARSTRRRRASSARRMSGRRGAVRWAQPACGRLHAVAKLAWRAADLRAGVSA